MPQRRTRTHYGRRRARDRFWHENAEKIRLVLIGGGAVVIVTLLAKVLLR